MGLWNRIGGAISNGWNKARNGISQAVNNVKTGIGNAYNSTKQGLKKGWQATKDFADKHAETIGNVAAGALSAYNPVLGAGVGMIANRFANDKTGWGRFAKSLAKGTGGSDLSSLLSSQSNASNQSNGHVATGYSISSTGNNTAPTKPTKQYNGKNYRNSKVL